MIQYQTTFSSGIAQIQIAIWFTIDVIPEINKYLMYFKLTPPDDFFLGEIIRDNDGNTVTFQTIEDAKTYGHNYILTKLIGEE